MGEVDLANSTIFTPTGDALVEVYRLLMEAFPVDKPVLDAIIASGQKLYTWTPYALEWQGQIVGNVSLVRFSTWWRSAPQPLVGVASVATRKPFQRRGIARHLLRHCLELVDREARPAVLFTRLADVYRPHGFVPLPQHHLGIGPEEIASKIGDAAPIEVAAALDEDLLLAMSSLYEEQYPNYDGKLVRDADYWSLYRLLTSVAPGTRFAIYRQQNQAAGYARLDAEPDRAVLSELVAAPENSAAAMAMLGWAAQAALDLGKRWLTLAWPPGHFGWGLVSALGLEPVPEPAGADREAFMLRRPARGDRDQLSSLQWPLADKF